MKKCLTAISLLLLLSVTAKAEWTDVTSVYMQNPDFENNSSYGWTRNGNATAWNTNYECFEVFNSYYFEFYQKLVGLKKGQYRLSVQGFYRDGGNSSAYPKHLGGTENMDVVLFAGDYQQALKSVYDFHYDENTWNNCWSPDGTTYYPNGMLAGNASFWDDGYTNVLEFEADGDIVIGIKKKNDYVYANDNWAMFDRFRLEYNGSFTQVFAQSITVSVPNTSLTAGQTMQAAATILPSTATVKKVEWYTSDPFVLTVSEDGLVKARGAGTAQLYAYTTDGTNLAAVKEITVTQSSATDTRTWTDITSGYIANPNFESAAGWTIENSNYTVRAGCMEYWNNGYFRVSQELKGLPAGHYRLSAQAFHRNGDPNPAYVHYYNNEEEAFAFLIAGDQQQTVPAYFDSRFQVDDATNWNLFGSYYFPNTMETTAMAFSMGGYRTAVEFDVADASTPVTIGIGNDVYTSRNWCIFSNFKLEYAGSGTLVKQIQLAADKQELVVGETVQISATVTPDNALLKTLQWSSSDETVATVTQEGLVSAIGPGTVTVKAAATDGSGASQTITFTVVTNQASATSLVINEIMAANIDEYVSPAYNFDGWVELYNLTDKVIELAGLYLSDEAANLTKWQMPASVGVLPAKGYKLVWFDSNDIAPQNAPFKLDVDGGTIFLSDTQGRLLVSQTYPKAMERVSYARTTDGGNTWALTSTPTPGKTNATAAYATDQLAAPAIDTPSRLFDGPFTATATIPAGTTLRYTTDGSLPTTDNGEISTDGIFQISQTTMLRMRLFAADKLASRVTTCSYILRDRNYTLPVVSVVGNNDHFYSNMLGVLVKGTNGREGHGDATKWNTFMNWERPVSFSYIMDGDEVFSQDVNLEVSGGWSRKWKPTAFKLKGNKELGGSKNLLYPFFADKPYIRNRTLQIRNGGNDNTCRFTDPALQTIASSTGINLDCQEYLPVHEFINGQYIGVLNMREPNNKHFVYANYGWDDDEIDQFEMDPDSGYVQMCGSRESFERLVDLSADAANTETYQEICGLLDIDAYANYMALQFYLRNWDWPQNNVKGFRHQDGGRYRFVLFDLDGAFNGGIYDPINQFVNQKEVYTFDQRYPVSVYPDRLRLPIRFVTLFKNMVQNSDFRQRFTDAYCMMGGSIYESTRALNILESLYNKVQPAMAISGESPLSSYNSLRNNISNRQASATNDLVNYSPLGLTSDRRHQVVLSSDVQEAQLYVNDTKVPTGYFNGMLFTPAVVKAVAPAGYAFQGWKSTTAVGRTLLASNALWKYYDQGSLDATGWQSASYSESGWKQGYAPLGYNNPNVAANTVVDYTTQKQVFYFRTTVDLSQAPAEGDELWLDYIIDDGFVAYVNGTEAGRYNMPEGTITYDSFANHYAHGNPDRGSLQLPATLFHKGSNTIAIEVHNESTRSSDILWEASLRLVQQSAADAYLSTDSEMQLPESDITLTASFRPLTDGERRQQHINPVRINEVSGSNSIYINEYAKKNDWVELYNTTDEEIDVEGMYLSDNIDKPTKYQISKESTKADTKIPAHGYLLVWCDKLATTSQALHASFKISGDGGYLLLSDKSRTWTDTLTYSAHDGNSTVGRYPDGAAQVYTMNVPTIAKANMLTSYAVSEQQQEVVPSGIQKLIASANGFRIRYGSQQLFIKGDDTGSATVDIFTADGRLVERAAVMLHGETARLSVAHLSSGFYVARATNADGVTVSCKFMK